MRKFFKWLFYTLVLFTVLFVSVLAIAYWNRDILLQTLEDKLNNGINGKFNIEKIDFTFLHHFPHFSVTLHNVYLRGNRYEMYGKDIFYAKKIFLDIGLYPLLKKEIAIRSLSVDEADIFIFKAQDGYVNTADIFKVSGDSSLESKKSKTSILLNLQKIEFNNVGVVYSDSIKNKYMSFQFLNTNQTFAQTDSGYSIGVQGKMHFEGLFFNKNAGGFLQNKDVSLELKLTTNSLDNTLTVQASSLAYKQNDIGISGKFDLEKGGKFALKFTSTEINPTEAKELLNTKLVKTLSKFDIKEPVTITVDLSGQSIPGNIPSVDVQFQTHNSTFSYAMIDFSALTLSGSFTNHIDNKKPNDDRNSRVMISSFKGKMEKLPIEGSVTFTELQNPVMDLTFTSKVKYQDLNDHLDNNRLVLESGTFTSEVAYKGKLSEYLDPTRTTYKGKLNGRISATDASLNYKPKKIRLDHVQLQCAFDEKKFTIQDLSLNVNGNAVKVGGSIQNFIPFFIRPKNKGYVRLTVTSPKLDLTGFTSKRESEKKSKQQARRNRKKMTDLIDAVYNSLEFDLELTIGQLIFRKFQASNFKGQVKLNNHTLEARPVTMNVAGGSMKLNFALTHFFDPLSPLTADVKLSNANIKDLFLYFNNFNQKTIHADNLSGTISADAKFNATVTEDYAILPPSMRGTLECKISNGGLKNFEPMENMSNFLFKKRDFSDVQFAELYSNFSMEGPNMDISRMEIQSSVLSLFLQGRYSFTDSTSLSVQIPLSNLKKRHKDFKPQNIGTHAKAGPSVFLHVYRNSDINSKIKIDYDPFKKWAKN